MYIVYIYIDNNIAGHNSRVTGELQTVSITVENTKNDRKKKKLEKYD